MEVMMLFDKEKAINSILWISNLYKGLDINKICQIFYYADQEHLVNFGSTVSKDFYVAGDQSPIPYNTYNLLSDFKHRNVSNNISRAYLECFTIFNSGIIEGLVKPNLDFFADAEILSLTIALEKAKKVEFKEFRKNLGEPWDNALSKWNKEFSFIDIAKEGGADSEMLEYIELVIENSNVLS